MSKQHYSKVPLSSGRVYKHVVTHAHNLVNLLQSEKTPEKVRRDLRRTLQNPFDCTGYQRIHEGQEYMRAFKARARMCRVVSDYNWATNPRLKKIAALIAAEREAKNKQRARRAARPSFAPARRSPVAQQLAA